MSIISSCFPLFIFLSFSWVVNQASQQSSYFFHLNRSRPESSDTLNRCWFFNLFLPFHLFRAIRDPLIRISFSGILQNSSAVTSFPLQHSILRKVAPCLKSQDAFFLLFPNLALASAQQLAINLFQGVFSWEVFLLSTLSYVVSLARVILFHFCPHSPFSRNTWTKLAWARNFYDSHPLNFEFSCAKDEDLSADVHQKG